MTRAVAALWRRPAKGATGAPRPTVLLVREADAGWRLPSGSDAPNAGAPDDGEPAEATDGEEPDGPASGDGVRAVSGRITTAVRGAREQVGASVIVGVPLGPAAWAATLRSDKARLRPGPGATEVAWFGLDEARDLLAAAAGGDGADDPGRDLAVLEALAAADAAGGLETRPLLVLRHAHARPRDSWNRADAERPLVARGRRESAALADLLQCWRPEHVVSSPWLRCRETLEPYLGRTGARTRWKGGLSESGHRRDAGKAVKHLRGLLDEHQAGLLCTHRPVLASVLPALAAACADEVRGLVPAGDPWLAPAEVLVAHVAAAGRGKAGPRVVAVERHRPSPA